MKPIFTLLVCCSLSLFSSAQNYTFEQAFPITSTDKDVFTAGDTLSDNQGKVVLTDVAGNVYTVGNFKGTTDFDPGSGVFELTSNGFYDVYVMKLDANGNFLWAAAVGGTYSDLVDDFALDNLGNIYIVGSFKGVVDFNPGVGTTYLTSTNNSNSDCFVLKLDTNGNYVWKKKIGNGNVNKINEIEINSTNELVMSGFFLNTVDFDPNAATQNMTSAGSTDIFVLNWDDLGNFNWVKVIGGINHDDVTLLKIGNNDEIIVMGGYEGTVDFDPGSTVYELTSLATTDIFASKLSATGDFIWVKSWTFIVRPVSISLDQNNNIYIGGSFFNTTDFDPGSGIIQLTSPSSTIGSAYVLKIDSNGTFTWVKGLINGSSSTVNTLTTDELGNVYFSGRYSDTLDFDPGSGVFEIISPVSGVINISDTYIAKFDANGNFGWAKSFQRNNSASFGETFINYGDQNLYFSGSFLGTIDFNLDSDSYNMTQSPYTNSGSLGTPEADAFILKMQQCTPTTNAISHTSCTAYSAPDGMVYSTSGTYTATIPNSTGCDSIITINLTITGPNLQLTLADPMITSQEGAATAYEWVDCENNYTSMPGASSQSFTATENGHYAVIVSKNGCSDTSECVAITSLGLNDLDLVSGIVLYPNPVVESLTISSSSTITGELLIFDAQNRLILQQKVHGMFSEVDCKFNSGLYFIMILDDRKQAIYRSTFVKLD